MNGDFFLQRWGEKVEPAGDYLLDRGFINSGLITERFWRCETGSFPAVSLNRPTPPSPPHPHAVNVQRYGVCPVGPAHGATGPPGTPPPLAAWAKVDKVIQTSKAFNCLSLWKSPERGVRRRWGWGWGWRGCMNTHSHGPLHPGMKQYAIRSLFILFIVPSVPPLCVLSQSLFLPLALPVSISRSLSLSTSLYLGCSAE